MPDSQAFNRLSFKWNRFVTAQFTRKANKVIILFGGRAVPDLAHLRLHRPPNLKRIYHKIGKKSLQITMVVAKGTKIRGFREGKNYVIDLVIANPSKVSRIEKNIHEAQKADIIANTAPRGEEISLPDSDRPAMIRVAAMPAPPLPARSRQKMRKKQRQLARAGVLAKQKNDQVKTKVRCKKRGWPPKHSLPKQILRRRPNCQEPWNCQAKDCVQPP